MSVLLPIILSMAVCIPTNSKAYLVDAANLPSAGSTSPIAINNTASEPAVNGTFALPISQSGDFEPDKEDQPQYSAIFSNRFVPDLVKAFILQLIRLIEADPKLKNAFDIRRLTADEAAVIFYEVVATTHPNVGDMDPEGSAMMITKAIKPNFDKITTESFIAMHAYTSGLVLFYHGALTPENVAFYAQKDYENIRDRVNSIVNPSPEADLRALCYGYMDFVQAYGLLKKNSALMGPTIFANEWYNL